MEDGFATLDVEYDGTDYLATMKVGDEMFTVVEAIAHTELDFSSDQPHNKGWKNEIAVGIMLGDRVMSSETITETYIYTDDGLIVLDKVEVSENGAPSYIDSMIEGVVEYDEANGYPLSWTVSEYDWESNTSYKSFRAEYSDYANYAGAADALTVTDTPTIYYNLQGQQVERPSAGIFIKVNGNVIQKVMIK